MTLTLPRLLYILAALALYLLLWRNPVTIFMAACLSCLSLPLYRALQKKGRLWRKRLESTAGQVRWRKFRVALSSSLPLYTYIATLLSAILVPIAMLALLVTPQAAAGFERLRELQANNFQLPPEWVANIQQWRLSLAEYPRAEKMVSDFLQKLDAFFGDAMSLLLSRSVDFLGGTMTVLWTGFLFFTLTVIFTSYARHIRKISGRIFHIPQSMLARFTTAIH